MENDKLNEWENVNKRMVRKGVNEKENDIMGMINKLGRDDAQLNRKNMQEREESRCTLTIHMTSISSCPVYFE